MPLQKRHKEPANINPRRCRGVCQLHSRGHCCKLCMERTVLPLPCLMPLHAHSQEHTFVVHNDRIVRSAPLLPTGSTSPPSGGGTRQSQQSRYAYALCKIGEIVCIGRTHDRCIYSQWGWSPMMKPSIRLRALRGTEVTSAAFLVLLFFGGGGLGLSSPLSLGSDIGSAKTR